LKQSFSGSNGHSVRGGGQRVMNPGAQSVSIALNPAPRLPASEPLR
jgi:hypothetical protein